MKETSHQNFGEQFHWARTLANVTDMIGPVSHELNNVLNTIILQATLVARSVPDEAKPAAKTLRSLCLRATETMRVLDSQRHALVPPKQPVPLDRVVADCMQSNRGNRERIDITVGDDARWVWGNEFDLRRLIEMLLADATAGAGEGVISLEMREEPGDVLRLSITDNGPAVEPARLSDFFNPLIPPREGESALRRAACESLVHRLGGAIRAENTDQGGLRVIVQFNAVPRETLPDSDR